MPDAAKDRYAELLAEARRCRGQDRRAAWSALEDAHVLSQPWAARHVRVHVLMLRAAVAELDLREVAGQSVRLLLAGPGSLSGRYPPGNSGRANVSATQPMPVRPALAELLPVDLRPELAPEAEPPTRATP